MDLEQENAALKARVAELEDAIRANKNGLANLLTMMKEYAGIFLGNYQRVMAEAEADKDAKDLMKKHGFGKS
jgi:hypothetical protein